ncbi:MULTISPECIES: hypothetical protein [Acinetobacter]|uniref:Chromosome partitioning protein ParB n=1 Tax=Acinetobacter haemolyticus TaxID=29430 RepID=A0A372ML71_ACIHA|nr:MULTISPECIES: hypothetical protein [Acinetobacter]EEH67354.1 hypothetical protein HMPREF0023_3130 [Acinetobacter sp. ATCC 27244]ENW18071.1 hypothetical protein F926_03205 [Acinetobacter haemolyticus NIPH 261]NAR50475.1 hypothetical protein [Acinetobacter haemolyticus]NAR57061.1 hypothetical protein [Acinetobacter haemolyticus]NAR59400.1 hypothetical protein [Acinetobacter haemolyticus]
MRRQYHFRQVGDDTCIWDVHRLVKLAQNFIVKKVMLTDIQELNEAYWFPDEYPTTQQIIEHIHLIQDADLNYPIILCAQGRVMDGMHRVAKASLLKHSDILAVQFEQTPEPDFMNIDEDELDYTDIYNPK